MKSCCVLYFYNLGVSKIYHLPFMVLCLNKQMLLLGEQMHSV